jgi:hypothetical protein
VRASGIPYTNRPVFAVFPFLRSLSDLFKDEEEWSGYNNNFDGTFVYDNIRSKEKRL